MKKAINYEVEVFQVPEAWLGKGWDWSWNDSRIARLLNVSRQAVWSARKASGAPRSTSMGVQEGTYRQKILGLGERVHLMTTSEIAKEVGCSRGRVAYVLKENNLQSARVTKVNWPVIGSVEWGKSNEELAQELGTTPGYVSLYRWRKGIPSVKKSEKVLERV